MRKKFGQFQNKNGNKKIYLVRQYQTKQSNTKLKKSEFKEKLFYNIEEFTTNQIQKGYIPEELKEDQK